MAVRRLFGTATFDLGVFWEDKVSHEHWRIQYSKALDTVTPLKPYRLLDPKGTLWASADTLDELVEALPELCEEFGAKDPLLSGSDVKAALGELAKVALRLALGRVERAAGPRG